ncbi:MAG: SDR family oxidoreductase [Alphaproteobacteria bacterium]|nr:MAG: SDR family oxidoreductase [Alphaproteobacteria bacterium]
MTKKTVIVTGAGGGIGLACAEGLLIDGHNVTALDLKPIPAGLTGAGDGAGACLALTIDVTVERQCRDAVARTVETFGGLHALCHFAAIHSTDNWETLSAEEFNRVLEVNVTGSFLMARAAAAYMKDHGGGAIVLTSSGSVGMSGVGGSGRGGPAYVSSKAAIYGLNRALARSLGPHGIRVNTVSPGATETPMISEYTEAARENAAARTMVGRIGQPGDVADVARFLISNRARFVTGDVISASGGGSV